MKEKIKLISSIPKIKTKLIVIGTLKWLGQILNTIMIYLFIISFRDLLKDIFSNFVTYGVVFLTILIIKFIVGQLTHSIQGDISGKIKICVREQIFEKAHNIGLYNDQNIKTSTLTQLSTEGVEQLDLYYTVFIPQMIYGTLAPIFTLLIIGIINFWVSIILFLSIPLIPLLIIAINKRAKKKLGKYWSSYSNLGQMFFDYLSGISTIKIFNCDRKFHDELNENSEKFRINTMNVLRMQLNSITIMDLVAFGGASLAIIFIGLSLNSLTTPLYLALFAVYISADFFIPLRSLGSSFHTASNGIAAFKNINDFININQGDSDQILDDKKPIIIEFKDIGLSIDNQEILRDINLRIKPKTLTALVGISGSGKTKIAQMMMGFYRKHEGSVLYNNINVNDINRKSLSKHITYVSDNSYLFNASIKENLMNGYMKKIDDEKFIEVLKKVNLYDWVLSIPNGLDHVIEKDGINISGGQRQRLLIARSLLLDTDIIIFDEPTSNLDYEIESDIIDLICDLSLVKTVILITHKLKHVKKADQIIYINNQTIEARGNHKELIETHENFAKMYEKQRLLNEWRAK